MSYQRGDVILVKYPFADGAGAKIRPAIVVQCDANNSRLDNTIVAQITSRTRFARSEPTQMLNELSSVEGKQSGLLNDSAVSCENLYTIRQGIVIRKIGVLPPVAMLKVDSCLKASLELS